MTRKLDDDHGGISAFTAVAIAAVVMLIGLAVDVSGQIRAVARADNVAAEAARAGGQALNTLKAIQGGNKELDPDAAVAAATDYLADAGATGTVTVDPDLLHLTVTAEIVYQPAFLGAFGYPATTVSATATANVIVQ